MSSLRPPISLKLRGLLFFYSNANLLGCALALLGPLLLALGVIHAGWGWITLGLYLIGWLLGWMNPRTIQLTDHVEGSLSAEDTLAQLQHLLTQAHPHLNAAMWAHLASIETSVREVLPRLVAARTHDADLFTVRETVLRYLPETLANYVALPPAFRTSHVLREGQTAQQLLTAQLALLDEQMREVVANVASADAQALISNGQFLQAKFKPRGFELG